MQIAPRDTLRDSRLGHKESYSALNVSGAGWTAGTLDQHLIDERAGQPQ